MTQEEALGILKLGHNVYLTGPAGSGKTFLLNKYVEYLKGKGKGVGITASTGIAATHIGGITVHSWSGLGIKDELSREYIGKLLKRGYIKKRFENAGVLVIDEVSMLSNIQFDLLNKICQIFRNSFRPFGGMQIVCSGDFFQLPPIGRNGEDARFITQSEIWKEMDIKVCYLEEQHRQEKEEKLFALLNNIRGNEVEKAKEFLKNILFKKEVSDTVKLYTHNTDVDAINNMELSKINEPAFGYNMKLKGNSKIVDILKSGCLAPEKLILKTGAKVMFVKNNFDEGYINGTLGTVEGFNGVKMPIIRTFSGRLIEPEPAVWMIEEDDSIKAEIKQIPLRLAWAITVHKSQGMNLDSAEIDLSKCFVEGMGYVALSRLRSLKGLNLLGANEMAFKINEKVFEMDKELKEMSESAAAELRQLPAEERKKEEKKFLAKLPPFGFSKPHKRARI
ncbi:MAG: PIF1 family DEAD/DEAH box helicase [bacterium]|nr:PIF1 family DEAD/DEAH box helicase [bacterium]